MTIGRGDIALIEKSMRGGVGGDEVSKCREASALLVKMSVKAQKAKRGPVSAQRRPGECGMNALVDTLQESTWINNRLVLK